MIALATFALGACVNAQGPIASGGEPDAGASPEADADPRSEEQIECEGELCSASWGGIRAEELTRSELERIDAILDRLPAEITGAVELTITAGDADQSACPDPTRTSIFDMPEGCGYGWLEGEGASRTLLLQEQLREQNPDRLEHAVSFGIVATWSYENWAEVLGSWETYFWGDALCYPCPEDPAEPCIADEGHQLSPSRVIADFVNTVVATSIPEIAWGSGVTWRRGAEACDPSPRQDWMSARFDGGQDRRYAHGLENLAICGQTAEGFRVAYSPSQPSTGITAIAWLAEEDGQRLWPGLDLDPLEPGETETTDGWWWRHAIVRYAFHADAPFEVRLTECHCPGDEVVPYQPEANPTLPLCQ